MYDALAATVGGPAANWTGAFARIAWRLSSPNAVGAFQARASAPTLPLRERKLALDALAFIPSPSAADAMLSLVAATNFPFKAEATWWLFNRKNNYWKDYGILDEMQKRGLYNPDAQEFVSVTTPEAPSQPSTLPPIEKILALKGDPKRGQQVSIACAVCHQIGSSVGVDVGPDLTAFGKTQTREVILRSMIDPSAEISQGYDGGEVVTKNNVIIQGLILANGDPVIVKSQGGLTQTIPRSQVARQGRLNRSLMLSADQMGMSAQDLADVAAYLQSNLIPGIELGK